MERTCSGSSASDGGPVESWCTWSDGVDTLLPETDLVAMATSAGSGVFLPMDEVRSLAGALFEATEEDPPRWRVRSFPPADVWQALRERTSVPLAAGENIAGDAAFDAALAADALKVVQPDIAKWGGFSKVVPLARRIVAAGARYCPHWLGGGIGLLASAHALAAVGGGGMLEVDANANPLRSATCGPLAGVNDGCAVLNNRPGLGIEPDLAQLQAYAVAL